MIKVTCALIVHKNRILITQLGAGSDHPFLWEFPGGKVNPGETEESSIRREISEELDIDIEIVKALKQVQFDYGFKKIELKPFLCQVISEKIKLNEHVDSQWVSLEFPDEVKLLEADRKMIQENRVELEKYFRENMDKA
jgi:8-oxo-dGTP diphosphatase